jgi:hypothetical protein
MTEKFTISIHSDAKGGYTATVKSNRRAYLDLISKRYACRSNAVAEAEIWIADNYPNAAIRTVSATSPGGLDSDPICEPLR